MYILVINSGSATLKFKIFNTESLCETIWGIVERINLKGSFLVIENKTGKSKFNYSKGIKNHAEALKIVLSKLADSNIKLSAIKAIGHRVVHGGEEFTRPTLITKNVLKKLEKYNQLAPLHNPVNIMGIKACLKALPGIKNIAVFDTAYYRTIPDYAFIYPLPLKFYTKHKIRRYGFHGISHQYVAGEAAKKLKRPLNKLKIISCHLGSGASVTATKFGKAIDTSMGFTPLEGLMMSTRTGDLDPAIPLYLIKTLKFNPEKVDEILNKKSGFLGLTGTMDMREVLALAGYKVAGFRQDTRHKRQETRARLALNIFVYRVQKYIGAYAAAMGGVNVLVFTGGIGERSEIVRKLILKDLKFLGKFKTLVIPANEELMIAREISRKL
jgi:acetate kinase